MIAVALLHPGVSPRIVEHFRSSGVEIRIQDDTEDNGKCSAVLIFGGDGTVHRYLPELYHQQIPVLVVPAGSGNDFAKALGISSVSDALKAWKRFCAGGTNVNVIDLGAIMPCAAAGRQSSHAEVLFCCVAAIGMDAQANARANRMPAWWKGRGGYLLAALRSLMAFEPTEIHVSAASREVRRPAFFVAVGNAHRYGGGMKVTPRAAADDGLLDICFVGKINKLKLLFWVPTIFFGGHLRVQEVEYFQAQQVRIEAARELEVYADGDYICRTPVEIRIVHGALKVITPPGSANP